MKYSSFTVLCCAVLFSLQIFVFSASPACSAIADSPCDPDYYSSLEARALLEADREVTQNQNLIYKPDSVLSYTCFESYYEELADHASDMFSESDRWGNVLGSGRADHMNKALESLVEDALFAHLEANFHGSNKAYLGGRSSSSRTTPDLNVPDGGYTCSVMGQVWAQAKCMNFIQNPDTDGFYTFADYANRGSDRRTLPTPCSSLPNFAGNESIALTSPSWVNDIPIPDPAQPTVTYPDLLDSANCGSTGLFVPIPTGITVEPTSGTPAPYPENVCIQAGCHYDPVATSCKR